MIKSVWSTDQQVVGAHDLDLPCYAQCFLHFLPTASMKTCSFPLSDLHYPQYPKLPLIWGAGTIKLSLQP